jgi:hypothetical protein
MTAAVWLRAAGAEWPTSFLKRISVCKIDCWPLRTMQWARANGCPWGTWSSSDCVSCCETMLSSLQVRDGNMWQRWANATDPRLLEMCDAMLWAHAAGCPCDSWLHQIVTRVKYALTNSSSSSGGSGSSSRSNSLPSSIPRRWRCDALLFEEMTHVVQPTSRPHCFQ